MLDRIEKITGCTVTGWLFLFMIIIMGSIFISAMLTDIKYNCTLEKDYANLSTTFLQKVTEYSISTNSDFNGQNVADIYQQLMNENLIENEKNELAKDFLFYKDSGFTKIPRILIKVENSSIYNIYPPNTYDPK